MISHRKIERLPAISPTIQLTVCQDRHLQELIMPLDGQWNTVSDQILRRVTVRVSVNSSLSQHITFTSLHIQ